MPYNDNRRPNYIKCVNAMMRMMQIKLSITLVGVMPGIRNFMVVVGALLLLSSPVWNRLP